MNANGFEGSVGKWFRASDLKIAMDDHEERQSLLSPSDPTHDSMFLYDANTQYLEIFWGGYPYQYDARRIQRPEDLLWLLHHMTKKTWRHMTPQRVSRFIEFVADLRSWPMYKKALHPNEAPRPNHNKIREREKMTAAMRYSVIKRDAYRCRACGFSVQDGAHLHVDHIVPVSKGGATEIGNLQTLCTVCNLGKSDA
jgi:5-methylcytosine-specific restriction endonuclease McrA